MKLYLAVDDKTELPIRPTLDRFGSRTPTTLRVYTTPARCRKACHRKKGVMVLEIETDHLVEVTE